MEALSLLRKVLTRQERGQVLRVLGLATVAALTQTVAVFSIMPFMEAVTDPSRVHQLPLVGWLGSVVGLETTQARLIGAGVGVLALVIVANGLAALSLRRVHLTAWNITHYLSARLLKVYLNAPYAWFLSRHSSGLSRNLLEEVRLVVQGVLSPLLTAAVRGLEGAFLVVLLLMVDFRTTLAAGAVLGLTYLAIYWGLRSLQTSLGELRSAATETRFKVATEAMGGIKEVKSLGAEADFLGRFAATGPAYVRSQAWGRVLSELPRHALEVVSLGSVLALLLYLITSGSGLQQALPMLSLFGFAGYKLVPSFHQMFTSASFARYHLASIKAIEADLRQLEQFSLPTGEVRPIHISGSVSLENVTLHYPAAPTPALDGVSLELRKGMRLGIVGPTGSGKTTLVDVLLGLLEPDTGRLVVDGEPLSPRDFPSWRQVVGYVPQSIFLSDDSIARNIAFGLDEPEIDGDRVREVARMARLDDFVEGLPDGYDTLVGERGVRLSGGQRQRIGIARALYADAQLLLLDEATSALDGATEAAVMDAIYRLAEDITVVIVAHRLTTVRQCDAILLLDGGRAAGWGTYEELLRTNELFRFIARDA